MSNEINPASVARVKKKRQSEEAAARRTATSDGFDKVLRAERGSAKAFGWKPAPLVGPLLPTIKI